MSIVDHSSHHCNSVRRTESPGETGAEAVGCYLLVPDRRARLHHQECFQLSFSGGPSPVNAWDNNARHTFMSFSEHARSRFVKHVNVGVDAKVGLSSGPAVVIFDRPLFV